MDGLSQENLINGARSLIPPLTSIINKSIQEGKFPSKWKEAQVTPVLKKGSPSEISNYRPVTNLCSASKILVID